MHWGQFWTWLRSTSIQGLLLLGILGMEETNISNSMVLRAHSKDGYLARLEGDQVQEDSPISLAPIKALTNRMLRPLMPIPLINSLCNRWTSSLTIQVSKVHLNWVFIILHHHLLTKCRFMDSQLCLLTFHIHTCHSKWQSWWQLLLLMPALSPSLCKESSRLSLTRAILSLFSFSRICRLCSPQMSSRELTMNRKKGRRWSAMPSMRLSRRLSGQRLHLRSLGWSLIWATLSWSQPCRPLRTSLQKSEMLIICCSKSSKSSRLRASAVVWWLPSEFSSL